jgi:hypothetical protein
MNDDDTTSTEQIEDTQGEDQEGQRKGAIVHFLANNILNNAPLSKVVDLVKSAALNDANKMVEKASPDDLDKLEQQMADAQSPDPSASG